MNVLLPSLALFLLTVFCLGRMGFSRVRAVAAGRVDPRYYRDYGGFDEPEDLRIQSRHVTNLLEVPMLFYAVSVIAFVTGATGNLIVALCWAYVALRYVHTIIHLGTNKVIWRFRVFGLSLVVLVTIWLAVFWRLMPW